MNRLQGWTLSETLVGMIVAGVVFAAVMDGVVLFNRYVGKKIKEITDNMQLYEGYYLLRHLTTSADSVALSWDEGIELFLAGEPLAELLQTDSLLIVKRGARQDTLMSGISELQSDTDSVKLIVRGLKLSFYIEPAVNKLIIKTLADREKQYTYEQ